MNLTDAQFSAWMAALRSGHYQQTNGVLFRDVGYLDGVGYCCMGVLGKAALDLPLEVLVDMNYLSNLKYVPDPNTPLSMKEEHTLSKLNDVYHLTFSQIAAFIEGADPVTWYDVEQ